MHFLPTFASILDRLGDAGALGVAALAFAALFGIAELLERA
jgi:hypothetical protein